MCLTNCGLVEGDKGASQKQEKAASSSEGQQECKICLK